MIAVDGLAKRFGRHRAVDDLTFDVTAGRVTGFVGPNGAGKSTTMRMMVGLVRPDAGEVRFDGVRYGDLDWPSRSVGAALDAACMHPGRTARNHLRSAAAHARLSVRRVDEVLADVGLDAAAHRRASTFSLGMRQRLALATALLGEPEVLLLDEPSNGLDPDGIRWLRGHLRAFAANGGTVFVSSHLIAELAMFVDDIVVLGAGRLVAADSRDGLLSLGARVVVVETPQRDELARLLHGRPVEFGGGVNQLIVRGATREEIAQLALDHRIRLDHLGEESTPLEDVLLDLTATATEFASRDRNGNER